MVVCRGVDGGGGLSCSKLGCHVTRRVDDEITDGKVGRCRPLGASEPLPATGSGLKSWGSERFKLTGLLRPR